MRALFYQPDCGISGDMHLAAMLELGVPLERINEELARLPLQGQFSIEAVPGEKQGISGTRVTVNTAEQHHHRHHSHIAEMIRASNFAPGIEHRALDIFERIAKAEAKIHNVPVSDVHFHEVGAIDSIVDVIAAAIALEYLNVSHVYCSPIEVGSGFVDCAHGRFPVPAPATQELLANIPLKYGGVTGESTTPTGAAILAASVTEFVAPSLFTPEKTGYAIGHKDFERPNVLRVVLGAIADNLGVPEQAVPEHAHQHFKIEANIDDMAPEAFEPLLQSLFASGAGDAWCTPIVMKKSRAATCVSVLADSQHVDALADIMLNQSTTIGLRILPFEKRMLPREVLIVGTTYGDVQVKQVIQPDGRKRWKSEHDDITRLAMASGESYQQVKQSVDYQIESFLRTSKTN